MHMGPFKCILSGRSGKLGGILTSGRVSRQWPEVGTQKALRSVAEARLVAVGVLHEMSFGGGRLLAFRTCVRREASPTGNGMDLTWLFRPHTDFPPKIRAAVRKVPGSAKSYRRTDRRISI